MKYLICLSIAVLIVGANALNEEQKEKAKVYFNECITEVGANKEDISKVKNGDFNDVSDKTKCFTKCFFQKADFIDAEGNLKQEIAIQKLTLASTDADKASIEKVVTDCNITELKDVDACEKAYRLFACYTKNGAKPI